MKDVAPKEDMGWNFTWDTLDNYSDHYNFQSTVSEGLRKIVDKYKGDAKDQVLRHPSHGRSPLLVACD